MLASLILAATVTVIKPSVVTPATADLLNETFNNVTNYDDGTGISGSTSWFEVTASSGVIDSNETVLCPVGTGFSGECLQSTCAASNRKASSENGMAASQSGLVYVVVYFAMTSMTAWTDGQTQVVVEGRPTAAASPSVATAAFGAQLVYDADGITATRDNCAGPSACWRLDMRIGGIGSTAAGGLPQILPDTIYKLKFKIDQGSAVGEAIINSTTIVSGEDSAFAFQYLRLGQNEFSLANSTYLFDGCKVSTGGYVE